MVKPILIILTVYNGLVYFKEFVLSVINQSFQDFKFFILDDYSTNGSWEYLIRFDDKRIKLFNEVNKGLFYNLLNYLIEKSEGNLIKLWSQDDNMTEACIYQNLKFHNQYLEVGFSYIAVNYKDQSRKKISIKRADETPPILSTYLHKKIPFFEGSVVGISLM